MGEELPGLIRRAGDGDSEAVAELVRLYGGAVRAAVRRRLSPALRTRAGSEDVLQTALVSALAHLSSLEYRGEKAFLSWLVAIAEQEVGLAYRHHRAKMRDLDREARVTQAGPFADDRTTVSQAAIRKERKVRLEDAIATLPDVERQVVFSRSYEELSFQKVAERAGLPDAESARTVYRKALRILGRRLVSLEGEGEGK